MQERNGHNPQRQTFAREECSSNTDSATKTRLAAERTYWGGDAKLRHFANLGNIRPSTFLHQTTGKVAKNKKISLRVSLVEAVWTQDNPRNL